MKFVKRICLMLTVCLALLAFGCEAARTEPPVRTENPQIAYSPPAAAPASAEIPTPAEARAAAAVFAVDNTLLAPPAPYLSKMPPMLMPTSNRHESPPGDLARSTSYEPWSIQPSVVYRE